MPKSDYKHGLDSVVESAEFCGLLGIPLGQLSFSHKPAYRERLQADRGTDLTQHTGEAEQLLLIPRGPQTSHH